MELVEIHRRPELDEPVMIVALEGWIDAGLGAASAVAALLGAMETETIASFDPDALLDYRARRPVMHLVDGINTSLTWPAIELRAARDAGGNDLLMLVGAEPDHLWQAFSDTVVEVAGDLDVRLVVGLGAYPAPTPHTRPSRLASTATTEDLARAVSQIRGTLDVPAGVQAAIERRCAEADLPAVGLWAQVPHYAAAMAYPAAGAALLDGLTRLTGLVVDSTPLHEAADATKLRLDALIADNEEHLTLVRQLEAQVDAEGAEGEAQAPPLRREDLPTGDQLAAELQRYLREQDGGGS